LKEEVDLEIRKHAIKFSAHLEEDTMDHPLGRIFEVDAGTLPEEIQLK
jgi:hypothetical protein